MSADPSTATDLSALSAKWRRLHAGCKDIEADVARECADELDAALSAHGATSRPAITCPLCGVRVEQVASATLDLALWQHVNWACKREGRPLPPAPPSGEPR